MNNSHQMLQTSRVVGDSAVHGTFAPEQFPLVPSNAFQVRCMKRTKGKRSIVGGSPKELQAIPRQCQAQDQQLEQVLRLHPTSDAAAATSSQQQQQQGQRLQARP